MVDLDKKDVNSKDKQISKRVSTFYENLEDPTGFAIFLFTIILALSLLFQAVVNIAKIIQH